MSSKNTPQTATDTAHLNAQLIPIDLLDPDPKNPRTIELTEEEEPGLEDLAASIRSVGLITPISVVQQGSRYRILAGHRRTQAAKMAGLTKIPAVIHKEETQEKSLVIQIVENVQRQKLSLKDLCEAVLDLKVTHKMSPGEIAKELGRSKSWVSFLLSVAESQGLAKKAVEEGMINDMTWAYQFNTLPKETQEHIYTEAKAEGTGIKRSTIEAAKYPPPPVYTPEPVVHKNPTAQVLDLPSEAFMGASAVENDLLDMPAEASISVDRDAGSLWVVRAPVDNFVRLLQSLGRPVDTSEDIVKGLKDILA